VTIGTASPSPIIIPVTRGATAAGLDVRNEASDLSLVHRVVLPPVPPTIASLRAMAEGAVYLRILHMRRDLILTVTTGVVTAVVATGLFR